MTTSTRLLHVAGLLNSRPDIDPLNVYIRDGVIQVQTRRPLPADANGITEPWRFYAGPSGPLESRHTIGQIEGVALVYVELRDIAPGASDYAEPVVAGKVVS